MSEKDRAMTSTDPLHRLLIGELSLAGCFRPAPLQTAAKAAFIMGCYAAAYAALLSGPGLALRTLAIAAAAFFSVQAGFIAHEAGHGAITRRRGLATFLGHVFHTLMSGLSSSYFRHIHSLHHPHCNDRSRDPDMQSEFVSMYRESALAKTGFGKWISRRQDVLIWGLIGLQGFTLKLDGMSYVGRNPRATRLDRLFLALHFALWLVVPGLVLGVAAALVNYALMTVLIGYYVGSIFVVNHVGTRVIEPDEPISYFTQELNVTRNLGASRLHDFVFGGVNNHIEHHLFPSMPTARLRHARRITRAFCRRHGLVYREMSWLEAAREVTRHFEAMSAYVPS
jgi:fatty acid desaturase